MSKGRFIVLVSPIVIAELAPAPDEVRAVLESIPTFALDFVDITSEVLYDD